MTFLVQAATTFLKNEDGHSSLEYAVQLALIAAVLVHVLQILASNSNSTFNTVSAAAHSSGS